MSGIGMKINDGVPLGNKDDENSALANKTAWIVKNASHFMMPISLDKPIDMLDLQHSVLKEREKVKNAIQRNRR